MMADGRNFKVVTFVKDLNTPGIIQSCIIFITI